MDDVTLLPNETTFTVAILAEELVELDETILATLSGIEAEGRAVEFSNTEETLSTNGTITNDDSATVNLVEASVVEGNEGTTEMVFVATQEGEVDVPVTASFRTTQGTASVTVDYTALALADQEILGTGTNFTVPVIPDLQVEADETFGCVIHSLNSQGRSVDFSSMTAEMAVAGLIVNDDTAQISIADLSLVKTDSGTTNFVFDVTLNAAVDQPFTMDYGVSHETTNGADLALETETLNFAGTANEVRQITVLVTGEEIVELDETFLVNLSNLSTGNLSVSIADGEARATIQNDDQTIVELAVSDAFEDQNGPANLVYTATLVGEVDVPVEVFFGTQDGSATPGSDYTTTIDTLVVTADGGRSMCRLLQIQLSS
ncbi:hypothetical protein OAV21_02710 [bacterium]|jgi:fibronectin-binding autotransporter adhesin|nr:hypothetical protein [Verrucomicrobiales bacterium]MDB4772633.1 hypothetical protein [Verrucomicrobiales bacterium]MDC3255286.1 hypothetical protein [bacterium]MDF1787874.1 Calx-beta domain-containing protein [Verrucomicrobiales bacterium]